QREGVFPKFEIPARRLVRQVLGGGGRFSEGGSEISVARTADPQFGDFAANAAMKLVGAARKNPIEIANLIKNRIESGKIASGIFKKIEVAGPGFINFYLSDRYLQKRAGDILKSGKKYGSNNLGRGRKIQVEFVSANPTGPLHLGNGRGGAIGSALANILAFSGFKVEREYYVNDRGNQVKMLGASTSAGREFVLKHRLKENIYQGQYIKDWEEKNKKLVEKYKNSPRLRQDEAGNLEELGRRMAKDFLNEMIKPVIKKFGIRFDKWFSEKSLYDDGTIKKKLTEMRKKNLFYEKDGALWFRAKNFGDGEDRVLVKSDGEMTYFLSDLAYHWNKFRVRKFAESIDIWGADHYGYIERLKAGLRALKIPEDKLAVIITQMVRLIEGGKEIRMSKRAGTYVTLDELIDEVGADVAKFFFLLSSPDTHMDFDLKLAKEKSEKNPVYYVQYAHARICSILKKAKIKNRYQIPDTRYQLLSHP
ncbi:MAG: arginine--tRNA ligase, partial [bacterium]|nr:arginine--tRNA ligase [bacterium]